jgi:parallel beta-helix repeat protein
MNRKLVLALALTLLVGMSSVAFNVQKAKASGTIYIRADGSIDPPTATITTADNVTYTFADNINSEIVVEKGSIVIDGKGYTLQGTGAYSSKGIHLSSIENVTVTKTNIEGFWYGICIENSNGNTVTENNLTDNTGIILGGFGNTIFRNNLKGGGSGIWLEGDANNISENNITGTAYGIFLVWSSSNNVSRNNLTGNGHNFNVNAMDLSDFVNYVDASNTVDGKPIYYWINEHDKNVPSDAGYVALVNCTHISARNLSLAHNGQGLLLAYTTNSTIVENNMTETEHCIELFESTNNTLSGNRMSGISSSVIGLSLRRSSYNKISGNSITNNGGGSGVTLTEASNNTISGNIIKNSYGGVHLEYGTTLEPSSDNRFYNNSFIDNAQQVNVYGGSSYNAWDDGYPPGGNYWSDCVERYPDAEELNGSGLWDTPYVIDGNNQDRYPLMYPYGTQTYKLTITTTSGGTTTPSPGTHTYVNGTVVWVMALPDLGYSFSHWRLEDEDRTVNPIIMLVAADGTLEAFFVDDTPPDISEPVQHPPEEVEPHQTVTVTVNVTDLGTGVCNVTLRYSIDNGTIWTPRNMTEISPDTYQTTIPGYENCTWVTYKIVAYDNTGNNATKDNLGYYYKYHVIPEFPSVLILPLFMFAALLTVIVYRKKTHRQ